MAVKLDDRRLAAWRALLASHAALVGRLGEELQDEKGLPLPWYEVLLWINQAPDGRMRMGELAGSLLLTPSGVTRLVDRMEADGLVQRQQCPSDRRGSNPVITSAGRARRRSAPSAWRARNPGRRRSLPRAVLPTPRRSRRLHRRPACGGCGPGRRSIARWRHGPGW